VNVTSSWLIKAQHNSFNNPIVPVGIPGGPAGAGNNPTLQVVWLIDPTPTPGSKAVMLKFCDFGSRDLCWDFDPLPNLGQ
jgi:hypothetical protein